MISRILAPLLAALFYKRWSLVAAVAAASVSVAGCGGGGGGGGDTPAAGTSVGPITGTAATGAPIVGGSVQMICTGGTASTAVTSSATGTYSVTATGAAPCVVRITGGSGNTGATMYSLVQSGQTVAHVNQLTHMLVYSLAGGDPAGFFVTPASIAVLITPTTVAAKKAIVQTVVAALGEALGIGTTFDFLSGNFGTVGSGFDRLLDNISFSTTTAGGSATTPVIILKSTGLAILTINAITGLIVGAAPAVIAASTVADLGGLQLFVASLQARVFGNSATFANPADGFAKLSDVLGTSLSTGTSNDVFTLIDSANPALGVRINPDLVQFASLTAEAPTLTSILSGGINFLRVALNFKNSAGTVSSRSADVERVLASPAATASAWRLNGSPSAAAAGPAPVVLGTAANFAILAKTGITTTGTTLVTGDIGVSPIAATAITGFSLVADSTNQFSTSSLVVGKVFAANFAVPTPANMTTAVGDMETAFAAAAGRTNPTATELGAGNIGGMTLAPGLYKWSTNVTIPTNVTLSGGANDVWIFQIAGDVTIAAATQVILAGGAKASNIFWQVNGATGATLGTTSTFNGTILSAKQVILQTGAVLNGRALAQTQVTLDASRVTKP